MGTENDFDSFIQMQKQKLAAEREQLHHKADAENIEPASQPPASQPV